MPDFADLDTLGTAAVYVVVIGIVFAECGLLIGFFLPGDTLLFGGGLIAADAARGVDIGWLLTGVLVAAIAGETLGYVIGARMGLPMLRRHRGRVLTPERVARAEAFTDRWGVLAIISARWIPWVRTFAPLLAGATGMSWPKFLLGNVVGAVCWGPTLVLAGYLAASLPWVKHVSVAVAGVAIAATVVATLLRRRSTRGGRPGPTEEGRSTRTEDPGTGGR